MIKSIRDIPWECGKGWWPLIKKVAAAIDSFNAAHPDSPVEVSQIKQKFGGLRIYHYNAPEDIRQLIDHAIEVSCHTCERCGSGEGVTTNIEGFRLTLCTKCRAALPQKKRLKKKICIRRGMPTSAPLQNSPADTHSPEQPPR